jgi:vacuolar-type H+-ATPase subunit H
MIKNAERQSEEEVKTAQQRAGEIISGSETKVEEVIDRMVKLVTGV